MPKKRMPPAPSPEEIARKQQEYREQQEAETQRRKEIENAKILHAAKCRAEGVLSVYAIDVFPSDKWAVDVGWEDIEDHLERHCDKGHNLDLNPDYQRGHVWTLEQRRAYVEHVLQGGRIGNDILCACESWDAYPVKNYTLLDGKQRLTTILMFIKDEFRVLPDDIRPEGYLFSEIRSPNRRKFSWTDSRFRWKVIECKDRAAVLDLYLRLNGGGTPHSKEELDRVRMLRQAELEKKSV